MEVVTIIQILKRIGNDKEKYRAAVDSDKQQTELKPNKCFRCGSEDDLIYKFPKPPKDNEKRINQVCFSERGNRSLKNNVKTAIMITTKRYMHLWHECLVMMKVLVEILVTVRN